MPRPIIALAVALAPALCGPPAAAQEPVAVSGEFVGLDGRSHGKVELVQTPTGVLVRASLTGLPEGAHGFHVHEHGVCEPPFDTTGDHFNPADASHGFLTEGGPEAGDMPNVYVGPTGEATVEVLNPLVSLQQDHETSLRDADGAALVLHAGADDHGSQPSGGSGDPIACAVIAP